MPFATCTDLACMERIDYIIVGGGTAGLAVAARLSESPEIIVLVIEAGEHHAEVPEIDVPGYMGRLIGNPKYDWSFQCVPQVRANNRVVLQPRGKGLGGTSLLNFMGMFRPSKAEMDALADLGNKGWDWDSVLHYMKKSETLQPHTLSEAEAEIYAVNPDPAYHGMDGPIQVSFGSPETMGDINAKLFDTAQTLGIPRNPATGNGRNDGSMTSMLSIDASTAKRSCATAYLEPNLDRPNLLVLTAAHVTKILLEQEGSHQRAVRVELVHDGMSLRLTNVTWEVILAAGSYQTPQLLELSGIGNQDILSKHGISTLVDLPGVGENLQDHLGLTTIAEVDTDQLTLEDLADPNVLNAQQELYKDKRGLLTVPPVQGFVFLSADALGTPQDVANWQDHAHARCTEALAQTHPALRSGLEKQYQIYQKLYADKKQAQAEIILINGRQRMAGYDAPPAQGKRFISLVCSLSRSLSRGTVHIASADPLAPPAIDPNYFANEADLDMFVHILQCALRMQRTPPLSDIVKEPVMPPKEVIDGDPEGLVEYVRQYCRQVYHPVGTAAMMPREDGGVVDPRLKVYGTSNLRVVDLSVLPMECVCHTQSMAYAIAEKAADMIKEDMSNS